MANPRPSPGGGRGPWFLVEPVPPKMELLRAQITPRFPVHFILHADLEKGSAWTFSRLRRFYALEKEAFVSRYPFDVLDEKGALHVFPPEKGESEARARLRLEGETEALRCSRTYRNLVKQGLLYQTTKYPGSKMDYTEEDSL